MEKYINLFTDFGFKKLFGEEQNKDLLLDFLNTLLPDKQNIIDLKYLNSEILGKSILDRRAIFDLYCENDKGEKFIVELQRAEQIYFKERSIYYATCAIEEQAKRGKWDYNWQSVYTIAIMDFAFGGMNHSNVKSDVILYDQENQLVFSDKLRFIYLEMSKFDKTIDELETNYDKWLYVLKNISYLDAVPAKLQKMILEKVFQIAEIAKYNPKERKQYEESLKYYRDYENSMELKFEKGKMEGKTEALLETAKSMKQKGFDIKTISDITGLKPEEISKL
jgi:predicted transposase/invertase (TIGR01784 family)